jgi:lactoylglutathione lyase
MKCTYDHTHIRCADPAASKKWWIEVMGAEDAGEGSVPGMTISRVKMGGVLLSFSPKREEMTVEPLDDKFRYGVYQIGFWVDDMDATLAEIKDKGVEIASGPIEPNPGMTVCFVKAPDGIEIELMYKSA